MSIKIITFNNIKIYKSYYKRLCKITIDIIIFVYTRGIKSD